MTEELVDGPLRIRLASAKGTDRLKVYEELVTLFTQAEETSVLIDYADAIDTIIDEKNALAQEKGMPAIVVWVDRSSLDALSNAESLSTKLITKCLSGRPKTKQSAQEALLLLIERDQQGPVLNALLQELKNKNPKISAAALEMIKISVELFGVEVNPIKEITKILPDLFDNNDKKIREEAIGLTIELYKYIGPIIIKKLQNIRPAQMKELEQKFENETVSAQPKRFQRSFEGNQKLQIELNSLDFFEPVDVLSKLSENFYENIVSTKWQERKEAIDDLTSIVDTPTILPNQLSEIHQIIRNVIAKDANVMIIGKAIECVAYFAAGLRDEYHSVAKDVFPILIGKFKEKKHSIVTAIHQALDSIFHNSLNLSEVLEGLCQTINTTKITGIKLESIKFLERMLKSPPKRLGGKSIVSNEEELESLTKTLITTLDDSVADVRTVAAECLGVIAAIAGEKAMQPFFAKLDGVRFKKVQEFIPKAPLEITPENVTL